MYFNISCYTYLISLHYGLSFRYLVTSRLKRLTDQIFKPLSESVKRENPFSIVSGEIQSGHVSLFIRINVSLTQVLQIKFSYAYNYTLSEDEVFSTASSPKSSVAGDARDKMAEPKASRKTSSRRSKKKDEVEELNKKWESRFSQIETRFDKFFDLFSSNDGNINKDTVTSGEQRPCQNQSEQDSGSSGAHRLVEDSNHEHFPTDSVRERENDDVVSLAPGHRERHDIGLLSEDEFSLKSETENPQKSASGSVNM
ncbi:unnamed protein product [Mytilus edulis]|uniref:Uncharacterized protein n=1 Tax=Mytilus edulis TaxID=6550 RepID=A0A8S3RT77_MYTED|nr:unnamed protein product [Mytilus edulis]